VTLTVSDRDRSVPWYEWLFDTKLVLDEQPGPFRRDVWLVTVPAGEPGRAAVVLTAGGPVSNSVTFTYDSPAITSLTPDNGPAACGTQLTIAGDNFGAATGTVSVGEKPATVVSWSNTSVVATVPAGTPGPHGCDGARRSRSRRRDEP
jgi:hypothetical protein